MSEEILSADMSTPSRPAVTPQAVVGVSICLMGIALTLDNFGIYELRSFAELWPIVPISIGVLTLMYGETRQDWVKGTLWLALGIFFIFRHPLIREVWPLVLIGLGGYLVWRSRTGPPAARKWQTEVRLETDDPYRQPPAAVHAYGADESAGGGGPPGEPSVPGGVGRARRPQGAPFIPANSRGLPSGGIGGGWRDAGAAGAPGQPDRPGRRPAGFAGFAPSDRGRERDRGRDRAASASATGGAARPTGVPRRHRRPDASRSAPRMRARAPNTRLAPSDRIPTPAAASVPRCSP